MKTAERDQMEKYLGAATWTPPMALEIFTFKDLVSRNRSDLKQMFARHQGDIQ